MQGRIVVIAVFVLGALLTPAGAALAATGPSGSGEVSIAQYGGGGGSAGAGGAEPQGEDEDVGVLGGPPPPPPLAAPPPPPPAAPSGEQGPAGGRAGEGAGQAPGQQLRQVRTGELPFTGWAAITVMFVGLALLTLGVVARWRLNAGGKPA
jgi:hypothetical protein